MTNTTIRLMTAVTGIALFAAPVVAEEADQMGTNRAPQATEATTPQAIGVERAKLSADLAAYGRQSGNPVALLLAGSIMADVGGTETPREKVSETPGGTPAASEGAKTDRPALTAETLFTEARTLARGDSELLGRIERTAQRQSKGNVDGPIVHYDSIYARTNDWYELTFRGGEPARLSVIGDGDTDLDLYVYDENGNLVCSDEDYTDRTECRWNPAWTGEFRIKISNFGDVYNNYTLYTN